MWRLLRGSEGDYLAWDQKLAAAATPATYSSGPGLTGPKPTPVRISDYWLYRRMGGGGSGRMNEWVKRGFGVEES